MTARKIDLNLFRVFEAVMQHRSVSGASRELGVTASAVSHALSRLRLALGDELFVSGQSGMEPTARALDLAPGIRDGLGRIDAAVSLKPFIPSEAPRIFRIAATDYVVGTILPHVVGRIAKTAPRIDLRIFPFSHTDVVRYLDDGRVDLLMGWFGDLPDRMRRTTIAMETEAIVVRTGHPLTQETVTRERLFAFPHIAVDLTGVEGEAVGGFLDDRGVWRRVWMERLVMEMGDDAQGLVGRVAISVPYYAAIPPILAVTDMVATLPRRLALRAIQQASLALLDLPYEAPAVTIEAVWHQRAERDAGVQWLIGEMVSGMQTATQV